MFQVKWLKLKMNPCEILLSRFSFHAIIMCTHRQFILNNNNFKLLPCYGIRCFCNRFSFSFYEPKRILDEYCLWLNDWLSIGVWWFVQIASMWLCYMYIFIRFSVKQTKLKSLFVTRLANATIQFEFKTDNPTQIEWENSNIQSTFLPNVRIVD